MFKTYYQKAIKSRMSNLLCVSRLMLCKKGTSLIEIMLYVAIVGMLIATFINFSLYIHRAHNKSFTVNEVHANVRVALDLISQRLRAAKSVNVDNSIFDSNPGALSLEMNNPVINPTVFNLDEDSGTLHMTEGVGLSMAITDEYVEIANLVFSYLEERNIESVSMDMTVNYPGASQDFQYFDEVYTANTLR